MVAFEKIITDDNYVYILMEYCELGTLKDLLHARGAFHQEKDDHDHTKKRPKLHELEIQCITK